MSNVLNAPDAIWLNYGINAPDEINHDDCEGIGWSEDAPIAKANVRYVRADLHEALQQEVALLKQVISDCALAVGAITAPECSNEFKQLLPAEIKAVVDEQATKIAALQAENERLVERNRLDGEKLVAAVQHMDAAHARAMELRDENERLRGMVPRWIPCSERLPGLDVPVLVISGPWPDQICAAMRNDGGDGWIWAVTVGHFPTLNDIGSYEVDDDYEFSHWMPLPSPAPVDAGKEREARTKTMGAITHDLETGEQSFQPSGKQPQAGEQENV